jgi:hypothetical protein
MVTRLQRDPQRGLAGSNCGRLASVITIWNVVLGVAVMLWAFGYCKMKQLFSKSKKHAQEQPDV